MEFPNYFFDEQVKGHFKSFKHQHIFKQIENQTIMTDILEYETPFGFIGKLFDKFILQKHLTNFILHRNQILEELSENNQHQPPQNRHTFYPKRSVIRISF